MIHYFQNPTDPSQYYYSYLPDDATPDELEQYRRFALKVLDNGSLMFIAVIVLLAVMVFFTGCTPQRIVSDTSEQHYTQEMLKRMDSMLRVKTVTQQDSTWRQEILRQFKSIREKSDTSHSVTLNVAGDTIRERIIINNVRETTSESERLEREVLMRRLETVDSIVHAQNLQLVRMDSLLHRERQVVEKEVPARLNWFQQMQLWLGRLVLVALALCASVFIIRWWLRQKKVI